MTKVIITSDDQDMTFDCYSLSAWKKWPMQMLLHGTANDLAVARSWLTGAGNYAKARPVVTVGPGWSELRPDGRQAWNLLGSARYEGRTLGLLRCDDPRCLWDKDSDDELYHWLTNNLTTPILPEWIRDIRLALADQYLRPMYGVDPKGLYVDNSLTPTTCDRIIQGLVKRRVLLV